MWDTCATCLDSDGDNRWSGCNQYKTVSGPDCNDSNTNVWNTCATCKDTDADTFWAGCNRYQGINGPDCNDNNNNTWNTCATCNDDDADSYFESCNTYNGINGPDCNDANNRTWNTCATCMDADGDTWYGVCDDYTGINGPDCNDANTYSWSTCATCVDADLDSWFALCDRYSLPGVDKTIGTGTSSTSLPFSTNYHDTRLELIYLASEIGQAGTIFALALDVTTVPGQEMNNFTIRLKHTSLANHSTLAWQGPDSGWTKVYQNASEPRGATGWRTFTFTTPFVYNGTSNLMVDISFNNSSASTAGQVRYSNASGSYRSIYYRTNSAYGDPLSWIGSSNPTPTGWGYFPNLRLTFSSPINGPDCNDADPFNWTMCDTCADSDGDGFDGNCNISADCDDGDPEVNPEAVELICDGHDNDCNPATLDDWDADLDGLSACNEADLGTSDLLPDTDFGCEKDGAEVAAGRDPLSPSDDSCPAVGAIQIGAGTTDSWVLPFATTHNISRTQTIYYASEIGQAGTIIALALNVTSIPGQIMNNFTIRMKTTTMTSYSTTFWESENWTVVYQANEPPPGSHGWRIFTFSTPFVYDGFSNLVIDFSFANTSYSSWDGYVTRTDFSVNRSVTCRTNSDVDPLTWAGSTPAAVLSTTIANIGLGFDSTRFLDSDNDGMSDPFETYYSSCLDALTDDADGDPDSDSLISFDEYLAVTNPCDPDTDSDGMPDGWEINVGGSCGMDPRIDDSWYDPDGDDLSNLIEYMGNTDPCDYTVIEPDADADGLTYPEEISIGTDPTNPDSDDDGLTDGDEYHNLGTSPTNPDSDNDGLEDGYEYNTLGTDPTYWDSDGDALPDGFEVANLSGHTAGMNLDPLKGNGDLGNDAILDFDGDGIPNVHEYWNGTSPWVWNPKGAAACGYWGEGDGDGIVGPGDVSTLIQTMKDQSPDYGLVFPGGAETLELDMDGIRGPGDLSILRGFMKNQVFEAGDLGSRPDALERVYPPTGQTLNVDAGDTTHVTVAVHNESTNPSWTYSPGIPVVFSIAPSSYGAATILGGEGEETPGTRYDLSSAMATNGQATVVIRVDGPGNIVINARILQCGSGGTGRYCGEITLGETIVVTGH
jgi:hypothetical protein